MNALKTRIFFAACIATTTLACTPTWAQDAARSCGSVTGVERRIVERSEQGVEALRSYVWTTRSVHGIDMQDVKDSLDAWQATVSCQKQMAAATATTVVAETPVARPRVASAAR